MKITTIIGARPQFIKSAPVSKAFSQFHEEILIHTGQHYDRNLSAVFFGQLGIPEPKYNLGVGSGTHGWQTGNMLIALEEVLLEESPDWVLVYGDTNSTLAGALAASKVHVPLAHIEAGLRSYNRRMPEEINRVLVDHVSDILFCPTAGAVDNLEQEGITTGVHCVGDVMYDALLHFLPIAEETSSILLSLDLQQDAYILATIHRAENTDDPTRLRSLMSCLEVTDCEVVLPIHPRTGMALTSQNIGVPPNVRVIEPLGYLDMILLEKFASAIMTDSGGVQKEAYLLGVPCLTFREDTEWTETVQAGWNTLVGVNPSLVQRALQKPKPEENPPSIYGAGNASGKIKEILERAYRKSTAVV